MDALTRSSARTRRGRCRPYALWLQAHDDIVAWCLGPGVACRGSRLIPTIGERRAGLRPVQAGGPDGGLEPWSLQVLEISGDEITGVTFFLDTAKLFPLFGLPPRLDN